MENTELSDILELVAKGGGVKRYHNEMIENQTVGHHSFGVAWFCWLLSHRSPTAELLYAAISHDIAEGVVGDVPSPTKRAIPGLRKTLADYEDKVMTDLGLPEPRIDAGDVRILKFADIFEGMLYCITQRSMGNRNVDKIFANYRDYSLQMEPSGIALEIFHTLVEGYINVSE